MKNVGIKEIRQQVLKIRDSRTDLERKHYISEYQKWFWESQVDIVDDILFEHLSDFAIDLEYYDPNEKESPPFYGNDKLKKEIAEILEKLNLDSFL